MTLVEKGRHDDELIDALMVCGRESRATPDLLPIQMPLVPEGDSYALVPLALGYPPQGDVGERGCISREQADCREGLPLDTH